MAIEAAPAPSRRATLDLDAQGRTQGRRGHPAPLLAAVALALVACSPTGQEATQEPAEAASTPAATAADEAEAEVTAATDPTDAPEAPEPTEAAGPEASPDAADAPPACEALAERTDWAFIVTEAPAAGQRVATGFHARGCANVFEAALSWRLADGQDTTIAEGFGMASCGTGCVGTFDLIVDYPARDEPEIGYLEVFASSADDGRPIHVNRIPVVLQ